MQVKLQVKATQRAAMYTGAACLAWLCACNKPEPVAESPVDPVDPAKPSSSNAVPVALTPAQKIARVDLDAEFHRTRVGAGRGYWVLGVVHNPHDHAVRDARAHVRLLDAEGKLVGEAEANIEQVLPADACAAVAVRVDEPVEHEQLELRATALPADSEPAEPPTLTLEHEPPQRAEFGGWYVRGTVSNSGSAAVEGARLEVQGLDASGRLLGVDWLVLGPVAAGAAVAFDLGELRYEQAPARFEVSLLAGGSPP